MGEFLDRGKLAPRPHLQSLCRPPAPHLALGSLVECRKSASMEPRGKLIEPACDASLQSRQACLDYIALNTQAGASRRGMGPPVGELARTLACTKRQLPG